MSQSEELPEFLWILRVQNPGQTLPVPTSPCLASLSAVRGRPGGGQEACRSRAPPGGGRVIVEGGAGGAAGGEGTAEPNSTAAAQEDLRKDDTFNDGGCGS